MTSLDFALIYLLAAVLGVVLFLVEAAFHAGLLNRRRYRGAACAGHDSRSANVRWLAELGVV